MILAALWPDSYHISVGNEECRDVETKNNEIICLPPKGEPIDLQADSPRVRVSIYFS